MKFKFVIATGKPEGTRLPIHDFLDSVKHDNIEVELDIHYNNTSGLPRIYNKAIDNSTDLNFIVFTHDDIWINDHMFFHKVISSKFDVVGAVGGLFWGVPSGFPIDAKPLIWTMATCGKGASGFMNHDLKNGYFLPSSYGVAPQQTMTLDGSIIIFTRKAIESGLRWDECFRFHWYDMDICFSAHRLGLKVGTANLLLTHESVGGSVVQSEFLESQRKFIKKWFCR